MGPYSSLSIEELTHRCAASSEIGAWEEFVSRFHRLIAKVILRTVAGFGDSSKEIVDDLIQETYLKFCEDNYRRLREFDHRHANAFTGYVQVVAANVVRDHFKSSFSRKRGANRIESLSDGAIPAPLESSFGSPSTIERELLIGELERHLQICVPVADRERSIRIFWLYYRAGLSARAIASLPGIDLETKGVESLIFRIKVELQKKIGDLRHQRADLRRDANEGILPAGSF